MLEVKGVSMGCFRGISSLCPNLEVLVLNGCSLRSPAEVLLSRSERKKGKGDASGKRSGGSTWRELRSLRICNSGMVSVDGSIALLPNIKSMDLSSNAIANVAQALPLLCVLSELTFFRPWLQQDCLVCCSF